MRSVQEIFDLMMVQGYYSLSSYGFARYYMCFSLKWAVGRGAITEEECRAAEGEILTYLHHLCPNEYSLVSALARGLDVPEQENWFPLTEEIYSNWAGRPMRGSAQPWAAVEELPDHAR